jgi:imidazolonepropionase-like amidohydrolase
MSSLVFEDATLFDGTGADPKPHMSVLVDEGRITSVGPAGTLAAGADIRRIECTGLTLMPGLTDAHVHFGLTSETDRDAPESYVSYVLKVAENIRMALDEGFTTVRDAGGLDPAYAMAVQGGQIAGPRILPSGSFISQTGGHGDHRPRYDDTLQPSIPGLIAQPEIVDGADAVRQAARRQIRRGATQVKVFASGGVMSPTDPLDSLQLSVEEMAAAVDVARSFNTYVMAHCHTSDAMNNALEAGIRSIEHGSILTEATARRMQQQDAFLVPTVIILELLARLPQLPDVSRVKLELVRGETAGSVRIAMAAGVRIGSGSDLLGPRQRRRAGEIAEKAKHMGALAALVSATRTNAELFRTDDRIGTVEPGKDADLILVSGNPVDDAAVLVDAANIPLVLQQGRIVKDALVPA